MLKKLTVLLITAIMLLTIVPSTVFADKFFYDGEWNTHNERIKLYFDDEYIDTDVPSLIVEDRTLVPVRAFFEETGATVLWNDGKKEVTVESDDFVIKLRIDSTVASVDGEKMSMDVPAKIVADSDNIGRTLVPIRFISENLGYDVEWDAKTYSVHVYDRVKKPVEISEEILSISAAKSGKKDTIKFFTSSTAKPVITKIANPDRLILDFYDFSLKMGDGSTDREGINFSNIRYADHEDYARIVFDISGEYKYEIKSVANTCTLILTSTGKTPVIKPEDEDDNKDDEDITISEPEEKPVTKPNLPSDGGNGLVVIDPGHGGSDPGAIGYKDGEIYICESEINLDISLRLYELLKEQGVNVAMTRTTDEYVGLKERAEYANNLDASLFICVHNNSATIPAANGTMVYYYTSEFDEDTKEAFGITSKELAAMVHKELLIAGGRYDRKIADGSKFVVLYSTTMPAILTECAFVSNEEEQELLNTKEFRQSLAEGISKGVIAALEQMGKR